VAIIEDNGDNLQKCEWCGKSGISSTWSGKKGLYCSFRCSAAGSYRMYVSISIIFSAMTAMVVIMMQIESSTSQPIPLILMFPIVLLIGLISLFIYAAYVGRSMRKERNASL